MERNKTKINRNITVNLNQKKFGISKMKQSKNGRKSVPSAEQLSMGLGGVRNQ